MTGLTKKTRIQWQGSSWQLRVVDIQFTDGTTLERGIVDHPGSVVIVPLVGSRVYMLYQYRLALDQWIVELPAGTREAGEDWLLCAQRELREETGYRATRWTNLGEVWPAPGLSNEMMSIYLAQDLIADPLAADPDEQLEVRPLPLSELITMAYDGRLRDAKSIIGILRATHYLGQKSEADF